MGTVLGRIGVETPKYEVVSKAPDYEIREYQPSVVAEVTYDPSEMKRGRDGGFMILASYIGAVGNPCNIKPKSQTEGEKMYLEGFNQTGKSLKGQEANEVDYT